MTLYAWKFLVPYRDPRVVEEYPNGSTLEVEGCLAIAIAATEEEARALLIRVGAEAGDDTRWLKVATVSRLDLDVPCRLCWVR